MEIEEESFGTFIPITPPPHWAEFITKKSQLKPKFPLIINIFARAKGKQKIIFPPPGSKKMRKGGGSFFIIIKEPPILENIYFFRGGLVLLLH